jgi:hypothetical protein
MLNDNRRTSSGCPDAGNISRGGSTARDTQSSGLRDSFGAFYLAGKRTRVGSAVVRWENICHWRQLALVENHPCGNGMRILGVEA